MANINKIQLPNGTQYDIEDAVARGKSVMVVTITSEEDSQTGETTYSADKTYAEISAHIEDGGIAFCEYNGIYYPMTYCDDYVVFELTGVIGEQQVRSDTFYIGNNNGDYVEYESNLTSGEVFIVTFSGSGNNRSCNKTYSEIYTAYFQNKVILGRRGDVATTPIYHLSSASNDEFVFTAVNATDSSTVFFYSYTIQSDNTITYSEYSSSKMMVVTLSNVSDGQGTASKTSSQIMQYDGPVVCFYNGSIFYLKSIDVQDADTIYASFGEINSSGEYTSIVINYSGNASITTNSIGGTQEQSDWEEDDTTDLAHVLNRPAIRAGEGENSIIEGQIEQDDDAAEYTLTISGAANATTFTYTTQDTLPSAVYIKQYGVAVYVRSSTSTVYRRIESLNTTNGTIKLNNNLSTSAITNGTLTIYYAYKSASGINSHAEGFLTSAKSNYSHAEGQATAALAIASHTEGSATAATGNSAHAEGTMTIATGIGSHTEGGFSISKGTRSHAEGYYTIAGSTSQHVQGKYNIEDSNDTYAHIVGNGTSDNARSNAHTLDWSGNGWYAGKVSAGTVASPATVTNANDLTTKAYVDAAVSDSSDVMVVTVTEEEDQQTGETTYSADKTFLEIEQAYNQGRLIFLRATDMGYALMPLFQISNDGAFFMSVGSFGDESPTVGEWCVSIEYDNTVYVWGQSTKVIPSPSSTSPIADGTATIGTAQYYYALADHVHPTDTSRAPVNSPALTGTPTAPTAAAGTNTTQIATTQFVNSAVSSALTSVMTYKGTKATVAALPSSGNAVGDVWHVTANGSEYAWDGSTWQELGTSDKEVMVVTVTSEEDQQTGEMVYSADKTVAQIYNHLSNGGYVYAKFNYYIYHLEMFDSYGGRFSRQTSETSFETIGMEVGGNTDIVWFDYPSVEGALAGTETPLMDGTATVGSSNQYAREDHVHPSDSTKANVTDVLTKTNTTAFTPTADYHPATKAYVDTHAGASSLSGLTDTTISSPSNGQILTYDSTTSKWTNSNQPNIPSASSTTPVMDGTASAGSSSNYARADHVHPSDTTKANASDVLTKTNTTAFTPTADYQPATKKYVDDHSSSGVTYQLSMTNNVITLTGSDSSTSSVTLPVYNGSVSVVTGGGS